MLSVGSSSTSCTKGFWQCYMVSHLSEVYDEGFCYLSRFVIFIAARCIFCFLFGGSACFLSEAFAFRSFGAVLCCDCASWSFVQFPLCIATSLYNLCRRGLHVPKSLPHAEKNLALFHFLHFLIHVYLERQTEIVIMLWWCYTGNFVIFWVLLAAKITRIDLPRWCHYCRVIVLLC